MDRSLPKFHTILETIYMSTVLRYECRCAGYLFPERKGRGVLGLISSLTLLLLLLCIGLWRNLFRNRDTNYTYNYF